MQGFSQEDRSKFIRYCWGRSRLPKPSSWPPNTPFKLTKHNGDDRMLPLSHTWYVAAPTLQCRVASRRCRWAATGLTGVRVCAVHRAQLLPNRAAVLLDRRNHEAARPGSHQFRYGRVPNGIVRRTKQLMLGASALCL